MKPALFRFLVICLFAYSLIRLFPIPSAYAAGEWVNDYATDRKDTDTNDSVNAGSYAKMSTNSTMASWVEDIMGGVEGVTVPVGAYKNDPSYVQRMNQKSAVAGVNNLITAMYMSPPADLALWVRDTGQTLGFLPKQSFAQGPGIGFSGLSALLPIWRAFRNIAYLLLAIVMVVIGFLVMFRKKIDPKTVMTVQNALPRIVITLLLITFSYAIVGIMIDLMYLVMLLGMGVLSSTGMVPPLPQWWQILIGQALSLNPVGTVTTPFILGQYKNAQQVFTQGGLIGVYNALFPFGTAGMANLAINIFGAGSTGVLSVIGGIVGTLIEPGVGTAIGALAPSVLAGLLISLAVLFTFIRLLILFLSAYIHIVLSLITAPIQLLAEAIPGSSGFSSWFKNLLSHIAVFPVASLMFMLSYMLSNSSGLLGIQATAKQTGNIWSPPFLIGNWGGTSVQAISALFSLGFLMATPSICNSIKEALKAKPLIPAGPGALMSPITGAYQTGMGVLSQFYYLKMLLPQKPGPHDK